MHQTARIYSNPPPLPGHQCPAPGTVLVQLCHPTACRAAGEATSQSQAVTRLFPFCGDRGTLEHMVAGQEAQPGHGNRETWWPQGSCGPEHPGSDLPPGWHPRALSHPHGSPTSVPVQRSSPCHALARHLLPRRLHVTFLSCNSLFSLPWRMHVPPSPRATETLQRGKRVNDASRACSRGEVAGCSSLRAASSSEHSK